MRIDDEIPEPLLFNPLKHYLNFIRDFVGSYTSVPPDRNTKYLVKELKHLGTSVMDVYSGNMPLGHISEEIVRFLYSHELNSKATFESWAGRDYNGIKIITISDGSQWALKFHNNEKRFVHIFPARQSPHTFRVKSNTLKSAILYLILIGKDFVTEDDLNKARAMTGLSPVKEVADTEAVTEMIEILRS